MPPIRKHGKKHCRFLPSNQRKGIHMLQPLLFLLKSVNTVLWEQVWLLSALMLLCHGAMFKEEKRSCVLYHRSKNQEDKSGSKGLCEKKKNTSINKSTLNLGRICHTVCQRGNVWTATSKNEDHYLHQHHSAHRWHLGESQILRSTSVIVPMTQKWQSHYWVSGIIAKAAGNLSFLRLVGSRCFSVLSW